MFPVVMYSGCRSKHLVYNGLHLGQDQSLQMFHFGLQLPESHIDQCVCIGWVDQDSYT